MRERGLIYFKPARSRALISNVRAGTNPSVPGTKSTPAYGTAPGFKVSSIYRDKREPVRCHFVKARSSVSAKSTALKEARP